MHIAGLTIGDLPPLRHYHVRCDERVNLFVGPNATGKSTILRAIHGLDSVEIYGPHFPIEFHSSDDNNHSFIAEASEDCSTGIFDSAKKPWDALPLLYIPATRINLPIVDLFTQEILGPVNEETDSPLKQLFDTGYGIFDGEYLEHVFKEIREIMTEHRSAQEQFRKALDVGYSCAKSICSEVIHDDAPHSYIESGIESEPTAERIVHYGMGIGTSDDILGEPLYAGALSSGTQGTLLWIYTLALKIMNHYAWQEGWEKKPAILLIDEIENHLHPTWQRRVIPALLKYFPALQIFATTHSPFVVAGLKAGQVHLLRRNEEGRVTVTTNTQDIIGWTADEILRTMMDVEDPTDAETAAAARELRQLRNEAPRDDPEYEKQRQERMQELRQLVDRDLLAGGPMAAQRELFEEQFAEALKKYQQSRDLNRETG